MWRAYAIPGASPRARVRALARARSHDQNIQFLCLSQCLSKEASYLGKTNKTSDSYLMFTYISWFTALRIKCSVSALRSVSQ